MRRSYLGAMTGSRVRRVGWGFRWPGDDKRLERYRNEFDEKLEARTRSVDEPQMSARSPMSAAPPPLPPNVELVASRAGTTAPEPQQSGATRGPADDTRVAAVYLDHSGFPSIAVGSLVTLVDRASSASWSPVPSERAAAAILAAPPREAASWEGWATLSAEVRAHLKSEDEAATHLVLRTAELLNTMGQSIDLLVLTGSNDRARELDEHVNYHVRQLMVDASDDSAAADVAKERLLATLEAYRVRAEANEYERTHHKPWPPASEDAPVEPRMRVEDVR